MSQSPKALSVHRSVQREFLDELTPRLNDVAHQAGEHFVGVVGVGDFHLQERAGFGVERGFPELLGVHFAQAFGALHGNAFAALVPPAERAHRRRRSKRPSNWLAGRPLTRGPEGSVGGTDPGPCC